jgi:hypothetical protein
LGEDQAHQAPPFSVIVRTNARPPRRPCADTERSFSSIAASTFAAAALLWWFVRSLDRLPTTRDTKRAARMATLAAVAAPMGGTSPDQNGNQIAPARV